MSLKLENLEDLHDKGGKIEGRCPACAEKGGDSQGIHLVIFPDGKFACAANPGDEDHRRRIWQLAGENSHGVPIIRRPIIPKATVSIEIKPKETLCGRDGRVSSTSYAGNKIERHINNKTNTRSGEKPSVPSEDLQAADESTTQKQEGPFSTNLGPYPPPSEESGAFLDFAPACDVATRTLVYYSIPWETNGVYCRWLGTLMGCLGFDRRCG